MPPIKSEPTKEDKNAKRLMKDTGELKEYLTYKRLFAKYALSESEEKIINTLDVTGISALVKLYDKITNVYEYTKKESILVSWSRIVPNKTPENNDSKTRFEIIAKNIAINGGSMEVKLPSIIFQCCLSCSKPCNRYPEWAA